MKTKFGTVVSFNPKTGLGQIRPDGETKRILPFNRKDNYILMAGDTEPYFTGPQRPPVEVKLQDRLAFREVHAEGNGSVVKKFATEASFQKIAAEIIIYHVYRKGEDAVKVGMQGAMKMEGPGLRFFIRKNGKLVRCKDPRPKVSVPSSAPTLTVLPEPAIAVPLPVVYRVDIETLDEESGEIKKDNFAGSLEELMGKYPNGELTPNELREVRFSVSENFPRSSFVPCTDPRPQHLAAAA